MAEGVPVAAPTENQKKRRRDIDDHAGPASHSDRIPQPPPPQSGNEKPINYLCRPNETKLRLFQSENEAFSDILSLINDYEGVLSRHESLAAKLGAKLTSPRLLRAMESLFEGPISATPLNQFGETLGATWCAPSWLEIVDYAASNPRDFNLSSTPDGRRVCQFNMNNVHVEIGEDDWRLIMSGAIDRFRLVPPQPPEQDEVAELATIDILEKRLQTLIKEADEVARKARRLNYHLSGRKAAINSRRSSPTQNTATTQYPSVTQQRLPPSGGLNPAYDLHADLLQQFLAPTNYQQTGTVVPQPPSASQPTSDVSRPPRPTISSTAVAPSQTTHILTPNSRRSPAYSIGSPTRREGTAPTTNSNSNSTTVTTEEVQAAPYRSIVQTRVEELAKGDRITPPCDRCRRLNVICVKNLTSCQGCTKKHAKCTWKSVTDDEIDLLLRRGELPISTTNTTTTTISREGIVATGHGNGNGNGNGNSINREGAGIGTGTGTGTEGEEILSCEPNEANTRLPITEGGGGTGGIGDVDTDGETPEASSSTARGKDTPPSSASSSTRGQQQQHQPQPAQVQGQVQAQLRSFTTGRHRS